MGIFTKCFLLLLVNSIVTASGPRGPWKPSPPVEECANPCGEGRNPCKCYELCEPQSVVCVRAPCCDVATCRTWCRDPCGPDTNPCAKDEQCVAEDVECYRPPCCKVPVCKKVAHKW